MTIKIRSVPKTTALSTWEKVSAWFAMNRTPMGKLILTVSTLVRVFLNFQGHTEVADTLKAIADLFIGTGATLIAAGTTNNDADHEAKINAKVRRRSGQFPAYTRRDDDKRDYRPRGKE